VKADLNRYEDPWTAEIYDFEQARDWGDRDVPFYLGLAAKFPGPVWELACGTGRVTLPLARKGVEVTGLDISPNMLAVARRKLAREVPEAQARLRLVEGNMADFSLEGEFGLIFIAYRSFQALLTREEQRGCLEFCARHIGRGGRLAINVFNPRLSAVLEGRAEPTREYPGPGGGLVRQGGSTDFDIADQSLVWRARYECTAPDGQVTVREHVLKLRYFFRFEMEWMLEACGFEVEALYGDFDRSKFTAESPEMIFVARRTG